MFAAGYLWNRKPAIMWICYTMYCKRGLRILLWTSSIVFRYVLCHLLTEIQNISDMFQVNLTSYWSYRSDFRFIKKGRSSVHKMSSVMFVNFTSSGESFTSILVMSYKYTEKSKTVGFVSEILKLRQKNLARNSYSIRYCMGLWRLIFSMLFYLIVSM